MYAETTSDLGHAPLSASLSTSCVKNGTGVIHDLDRSPEWLRDPRESQRGSSLHG